jgi:hypothetical protein
MSKSSRKFYGSSYADSLSQSIITSNNKIKTVLALDGDDYISLTAQDLKIYCGNGDDEFSTSSSASAFTNKKGVSDSRIAPQVYGEAGNDKFSDALGSSGLISGGDGDDIIRYHSNRAGAAARKGQTLLDGGAGNDIISYWTLEDANIQIHGGDGDDLIGVAPHLSGYSARQQLFYGDGGDDTFFIPEPPSDKITRFDGGEGYDTFYINSQYETSLVNRFTGAQGEEVLTFAVWQLNGVTYETQIILSNFETISFEESYVSYKHGNTYDPGGSDIGAISQFWGNGF